MCYIIGIYTVYYVYSRSPFRDLRRDLPRWAPSKVMRGLQDDLRTAIKKPTKKQKAQRFFVRRSCDQEQNE